MSDETEGGAGIEGSQDETLDAQSVQSVEQGTEQVDGWNSAQSGDESEPQQAGNGQGVDEKDDTETKDTEQQREDTDEASREREADTWNAGDTRDELGSPDDAVVSSWNADPSVDDALGRAYESVSGPPDLSKREFIPAPDLEVPPLQGQDREPALRPHEPSAPPKDLFGPPQHVRPEQDAGELPGRSTGEMPLDAERNGVSPSTSLERTGDLSSEERAERQAVAHPQGGVGFPFDKAEPSTGEMERWYKGLTSEQKQALRDPRTEITITAMSSRPGSEAYNQRLSEQRVDAVARRLVDDYGVHSSSLKREAIGEQPAKDHGVPDDRDRSQDRAAYLDIKPQTKQSDASATREAEEAGSRAGAAGRPPPPPERYTVHEGIRDIIIDIGAHLVSEAVLGEAAGAAKMVVVDMPAKFFGAVGELHDKNRQAIMARGVQYSVVIMSSDARSADNPHVTERKPYTVAELAQRIRENRSLNSDIQSEMPYLMVENTTEARQQFLQGMDSVVRAVNPVLAKARTPDERRQVISTFVNTASRRIADAYRQRSRR